MVLFEGIFSLFALFVAELTIFKDFYVSLRTKKGVKKISYVHQFSSEIF